eukprot:scaffold24021_cov37-Tisochrysis_lutea.AAC.1
MVDRNPCEPLRLVVDLCRHVKVDGELRLCTKHITKKDTLLPSRLAIACEYTEGCLERAKGSQRAALLEGELSALLCALLPQAQPEGIA